MNKIILYYSQLKICHSKFLLFFIINYLKNQNRDFKKIHYICNLNFRTNNEHNIYIIHGSYHDCEYLTNYRYYGAKSKRRRSFRNFWRDFFCTVRRSKNQRFHGKSNLDFRNFHCCFDFVERYSYCKTFGCNTASSYAKNSSGSNAADCSCNYHNYRADSNSGSCRKLISN